MFSSSIRRRVLAVAIGIGALGGGALAVHAQTPPAIVTSTATLADTSLSIVNSGRPGTISDDRGMLLGGIGSDLWHHPGDPANVFYMVTDRGPNGQIRVDGANRRTFPVQDFTPTIFRVEITAAGRIVPREIIPITDTKGDPVTGLSNLAGPDELPYDYKAESTFPYNADGLDTEGLVRTTNGEFWLADEYSPSLVHVDATGKVIKRFVPSGLALSADYPVVANLPAIYAKRRGNRGFESLAISADGKTLYTAIQSPLRVPTNSIGDNSRNIRIIAFDIASETVTAEYVYVMQPYQEFSAPTADEMKISGLAMTPDGKSLLVLERTDAVARVYRAELAGATNLLGSDWDDPARPTSLEGTADLKAAGVNAMNKSLVVDLDVLPGMPDKIEGITIMDSDTIVVANDNDFDINTFDANGRHIAKGTKSQILTIDVPNGYTGVAVATTPVPASPTATPTSRAPMPPNTGTGSTNGSDGSIAWMLTAAMGLLLAGAGAAITSRRR